MCPADALENTGDRQIIGLLQRRHIKIDLIRRIGKESNSLESVDEGMEHCEKNVYTVYDDPRPTEWVVKIRPALRSARLKQLAEHCRGQVSRRALIDHRRGKSQPHRKNKQFPVEVLRKLGLP